MSQEELQGELRQIKDRLQMIRFFDGYIIGRKEELDERKLKGPLVKSYLLEVMNGAYETSIQELQAILSRSLKLEQLDDSLFRAADQEGEIIGFFERLSPRIIALYSTMKSNDFDSRVRRLVHNTNEIDHVWLSGLTFKVLWGLVVKLSNPRRYTQLVFTHESRFENDGGFGQPEEEDDGEEDEETSNDDDKDALKEIKERRLTSFRLKDRIGVTQDKLEKLQNIYSPLYAISQLRFPSPVGRGGHDFYANGRVTNRSESFRDHRSHLLFVMRIYERLLRSTEQQAWYSIKDSIGAPGQFDKIVGSPLIVRFKEPLNHDVFNHWIKATFERKRNSFRLWGHPIRLGPTKVHVYGVDRHLWQPLFLELTAKGCVAIIPNGTCGNTVHRLVTNIQRYLAPEVEAFIGDTTYEKMVEESTRGVPYEPESR